MTIDISDEVEKRKNDTNAFAATATMPPNDISISSIHFKNINILTNIRGLVASFKSSKSSKSSLVNI